MVKKNKERFELDLSKSATKTPDMMSDEEVLSKMKRGFNNKYVCFEYPFAWQELPSEEEDEFTDIMLFNRSNNAIVKISTQPCLIDNIDDLKTAIEEDLKSKGCEIQQSALEKMDTQDIWDVFYTTKEGLEIEQFSILKDNNLYNLELYTKNNRDQATVKSFVDVIQTFTILKPSYKVNGDSYEKL